MLSGKRVTWDYSHVVDNPNLYTVIKPTIDSHHCSLDGKEITIKGKTYKLTEVK
jgi:hypothetical protein